MFGATVSCTSQQIQYIGPPGLLWELDQDYGKNVMISATVKRAYNLKGSMGGELTGNG